MLILRTTFQFPWQPHYEWQATQKDIMLKIKFKDWNQNFFKEPILNENLRTGIHLNTIEILSVLRVFTSLK